MLNYKHYTTTEMLDILTSERVFFSRHHMPSPGLHSQPDNISLHSEVSGAKNRLRVTCEIWNNMDSIRDYLKNAGFTRDENDAVYFRNWYISVNPGKDTGLLDRVVKTLDTALASSPLLLYASEICRSVYDYHAFAGNTLPKISISELVRHLGYPEQCNFGAGGNPGAAPDFLIAHYKREQWAAWVSGDTILPLFPSEYDARQFLANRARRCRPLETLAIHTVPPVMKSRWPKIYILVDPARSIDERIAWLQREQALLQSRERMVFPKECTRGGRSNWYL
ncbi:hypothetical protein [Anaeroselena agilis]|uniref:Uncharacterized protein n=1 Tax=Anaeroselena agilis TaxID=3063788 RepID=A0ABU3NU49_9FIRM|nr:hypothetical protein [Selenomonadales bacterium 4137-cl]